MSIITSNTPRVHTLPAGTMAATIKPTTSHAYFDVMDVIGKFEDEPAAHVAIMRSMAWTIDTTVINAARNVLFELYKEAEIDEGVEDRFSCFCQEVGSVVSSESWYETDGPVKDLADLLAIRTEWHDITQTACSRDDKDYNPRSLRELLEAEKPRVANVETREKLQQLAERSAKGDEVKAKLRLQQMLARDEAQAKDRAISGRKLIPALLSIIEAAARHAEHTVRFDQLSVQIQRKLTKAALNIVERAIETDVARRRDLSTLAYARILDIHDVVVEELSSVLKTRLNEDGELENAAIRPQVVIDHERNQKRVAATTE